MTTRRAVVNPFSMHYQSEWSRRAGDDRLPYWLRVAALGFGHHCRNGHAQFKAGDVALVLGSITDEGEVRPLNKGSLQRAINQAVEFGWLIEGSSSLCLIVPGHAVAGGVCGSATDECPMVARHHQIAAAARRRRNEQPPLRLVEGL